MFLTDLFLGAALSGLVGFLLAVPAIITEWREHGDVHALPILVDIKPKWGNRHLTHRELFFVALFVHLSLATLFGGVYVIFVERGWLFLTHAPYTFLSFVAYAIGAWLVVGLLIFPAVGFGVFGKKEEGSVWAEMLAMMFLLGFALWLLVQWFQPVYFNV